MCMLYRSRRKFRSPTSDNMDSWKAEQRSKVRRKKIQWREMPGKSRITVFSEWFVGSEGRKVGSLKRLVRSHVVRADIKNGTPLWREAHFQLKMHKTPACSEHFLKFRRRKMARGCGAKHISNSKCTKHLHVRTTFWSSDAETWHAAVARSTFPTQNAQNTRMLGPLFKLVCRKLAISQWISSSVSYLLSWPLSLLVNELESVRQLVTSSVRHLPS